MLELFQDNLIVTRTITEILEDSGSVLDNGSSATGGTNVGGRQVGGSLEGTTLLIGDNDSVFKADENGIYLGNKEFSLAQFSVDMSGLVVANNITLTGGTFKYGKTAFSDTVNAGYHISSSGFYFGSASDASYVKYNIGTAAFDIKAALNTGVGSTINGTYIDSLNVSKLSAGTITSKTISLAISAGTGDVYINAGKTDFDNTVSGFILGMDDSDSDLAKFYIGDSTNYLNWTGAALNIGGGTFTSSRIKTNSTGLRLEMQEVGGPVGNALVFYDSDNTVLANIKTVSTPVIGYTLDIYSKKIITITPGPSAGNQTLYLDGNLIPNSSPSWDLGDGTLKWKDLYLSGTIICGNIGNDFIPSSSLSYDIGSSSYYWDKVYIRFLEFYSYSTDPSSRTYGDMWHHYEGGGGSKQFRGCPWNTDVYSFDMTSV